LSDRTSFQKGKRPPGPCFAREGVWCFGTSETRYFFLFGFEVFAFLDVRALFGAAFLMVFFPEDRFFLRLGLPDISKSSNKVRFFLRAIFFSSLLGVHGNANSLASSRNP
jgi:hypothetical protein